MQRRGGEEEDAPPPRVASVWDVFPSFAAMRENVVPGGGGVCGDFLKSA